MENLEFEDSVEMLPFELAESPDWAKRRNDTLKKLQEEAKGLPMTTSQSMLMERLATFYTVIRKREADPNERISLKEMKEAQDQWLKMTQEFNKQLTVGEDKRREAMLQSILKIVGDAVSTIEDPVIRESTRKTLAAAFHAAGL